MSNQCSYHLKNNIFTALGSIRNILWNLTFCWKCKSSLRDNFLTDLKKFFRRKIKFPFFERSRKIKSFNLLPGSPSSPLVWNNGSIKQVLKLDDTLSPTLVNSPCLQSLNLKVPKNTILTGCVRKFSIMIRYIQLTI